MFYLNFGFLYGSLPKLLEGINSSFGSCLGVSDGGFGFGFLLSLGRLGLSPAGCPLPTGGTEVSATKVLNDFIFSLLPLTYP